MSGELTLAEVPIVPLVPLPGLLVQAGVFVTVKAIAGGSVNGRYEACSGEPQGKAQFEGTLQGQADLRFNIPIVIDARTGGK